MDWPLKDDGRLRLCCVFTNAVIDYVTDEQNHFAAADPLFRAWAGFASFARWDRRC